MHYKVLGPISKWVDDHVFFRLQREHIAHYNEQRTNWKRCIAEGGGRHHTGGRIWFGRLVLPNGWIEEFGDDMAFSVHDLSSQSPRSVEDACFSCCMADIDLISHELGIPWDPSKDQPWLEEVIFTGFVWNLTSNTVTIRDEK